MMKGGRILRVFSKLVLVVVLILLYAVLYLIPTVVEINRGKREMKDLRRQLTEIERASHTLVAAGQDEREIWRKNRERFLRRMPVEAPDDSSVNWNTSLCEWLRSSAGASGMQGFFLTRGGAEGLLCQKQNGGDLAELKKRLAEISAGRSEKISSGPDAFSLYSGHLDPVSLFLGTRAWVRDTAHLLAGLPQLPYHLEIAGMWISAGELSPLTLVKLRTYVREGGWNGDVEPAGVTAVRFIDLNSPLLQVPVSLPPDTEAADLRTTLAWKKILFRR